MLALESALAGVGDTHRRHLDRRGSITLQWRRPFTAEEIAGFDRAASPEWVRYQERLSCG